jgi:hypothetical protein
LNWFFKKKKASDPRLLDGSPNSFELAHANLKRGLLMTEEKLKLEQTERREPSNEDVKKMNLLLFSMVKGMCDSGVMTSAERRELLSDYVHIEPYVRGNTLEERWKDFCKRLEERRMVKTLKFTMGPGVLESGPWNAPGGGGGGGN